MRLIYLVGMQRSGSTLVGEYLGSYPGAAAVGELVNTWRAIDRGQGCSCGRAPGQCPVWGHVLGARSAAEVHRLDELRARVDRQRRLPRLLALGRGTGRRLPGDVAAYVTQLREQARVLAERTGATVLVDTSKSPAGLALAHLAFPAAVTALQVVRDPRAVAHSQSRHDFATTAVHADVPRPRSAASSAGLWTVQNAEGALVARASGPSLRFGYDRLHDDPRAALERLAERLGLAGSPPRWDGDRVELSPHHVLAGNPNRTADRLRRVRVDERWPGELTPAELRAVRLRTGPLHRLLTR